MGKLLGRIFVCFTVFLVSFKFNGYLTQIFVIWPQYGSEVSVNLLALLVPFKYVCSEQMVCVKLRTERVCSVLLAMLWWNCYFCIVTDPGRVPS